MSKDVRNILTCILKPISIIVKKVPLEPYFFGYIFKIKFFGYRIGEFRTFKKKKKTKTKKGGWVSHSSLMNQKQQNYSSPFLTPAAGHSFNNAKWAGMAHEGIIRKRKSHRIITAWQKGNTSGSFCEIRQSLTQKSHTLFQLHNNIYKSSLKNKTKEAESEKVLVMWIYLLQPL